MKLLRSLPHGHVAAALGTLRKIGLDHILSQGGRQPAREVALCIATMVARLIDPASKLATARLLDGETACCSLGAVLGLGGVDEQALYDVLDWLLAQQERIEKALARRHLNDGTLVLYYVTSTYFEGRTCPLARFGYNRDGNPASCKSCSGFCARPKAARSRSKCSKAMSAIRRRWRPDRQAQGALRARHVVLVGDRGMITEARIEKTVKPAGLDWITALRAPAIRSLVEAGAIQLSLFDARDLAEITAPDYPGERLVVCRNPMLADERGRKRGELLDATEKELIAIQGRVRRAKKPFAARPRSRSRSAP